MDLLELHRVTVWLAGSDAKDAEGDLEDEGDLDGGAMPMSTALVCVNKRVNVH